MAISLVKQALVEKKTLRYGVLDGAVDRNRYVLKGLDGVSAEQGYWRALNWVWDNVKGAKPGGKHPAIPNHIAVDYEVGPQANSRDQVWVDVSWRCKGPTITYAGNVTREMTKLDVNGKPLTVTYTPTRVPKGTVPPELTIVGEQPMLLPTTRFEMSWYMTPDEGSLQDFVETYVCRINSGKFLGNGPRKWMCTSMTGKGVIHNPLNQPMLYYASACFELRGASTAGGVQSWDPMILYVDPHTRRVPPDIDPPKDGWPQKTSGNGWSVRQLYPDIKFVDIPVPENL